MRAFSWLAAGNPHEAIDAEAGPRSCGPAL
jgi:hypothetical protein